MKKLFSFNTIIILNLHFYFGILTGECRQDRELSDTKTTEINVHISSCYHWLFHHTLEMFGLSCTFGEDL